MRGRYGPSAARQIFVQGHFAPGKMYLVIEINHQSFEQLGTSSRDIGSRKSEASRLVAGSTIISSLWKRCVWSIEHNHYLRPSLLTDTILCCSQFIIVANAGPNHFEAVEKMDLVIEHSHYRRSSKSLVEGRSTLNLEKRFPVATQGQPAAKLYRTSNSSGGTTFAFAMKHRKQLLVQARLSICAM